MKKEDAKRLFGINLKKLRLEKGMSQDELAKKLGYKGRSAINKIETGVNDMPRDMVLRCAEVLGVSPLSLFYYGETTEATFTKSKVDTLVDMTLQSDASESIRAIIDETKNLPEGKLQQILSYIKFLKQEENT
jgi:transcriptional regulator with XRE-family HTH domain